VDIVENEQGVMFPRLMPASVLVVFLAGLLQWILPLPLSLFADFASPGHAGVACLFSLGAMLGTAGIAISFAGYRALRRHRAEVEPWQPAPVLVTDGVFAWTRNPCYLGWLLALFGLALLLMLDWLLILLVPTALLLNLAVVRPEERHLLRKFGETYENYQRRVPRYLFIH
jgi:protein-S-isoprenylcysteine O-methyltransferase Ste14